MIFEAFALTEPMDPSDPASPASSAPPPWEFPPPSTACSQGAPLCHGRGHFRAPYLEEKVSLLLCREYHLIFIHLQRTIPWTGQMEATRRNREQRALFYKAKSQGTLCCVSELGDYTQ